MLRRDAASPLLTLWRTRRFAPFFAAQFCGAFNDNLYKVALTAFVTYDGARFGVANAAQTAFLITAIFIVPFLLLSPLGGQLADKWSKSRLMRAIKTFELLIAALAAMGFASSSLPLLLGCVALLGLHSTLFGPAKYAYLPEQMSAAELVAGNGLVEAGTFVAILLGTLAGGELAAAGASGKGVAATFLAVAVVGRIAAAWLPEVAARAPALPLGVSPLTVVRTALGRPAIMTTAVGISWLWFVGAVYLTSFFSYARDVLGADHQVMTLLLATFSVGTGVGALVYAALPGRLQRFAVQTGAAGIALGSVALWCASPAPAAAPGTIALADFVAVPANALILAILFLLSASAGAFSVPLYVRLQQLAPVDGCARTIAANNVLNALFMIAAALASTAMLKLGFALIDLFLLVAAGTVVVALWMRRRDNMH